MKRTILFFLLGLNMVFILLPQATSGKGILRGTVFDSETGRPVSGVTVKLYSKRAEVYFKPFPVTGKDGQWKTVYIRGGRWKIDFVKEGYITVKISLRVITTPGRKNSPINVRMRKQRFNLLKDNLFSEIQNARELMRNKQFKEALEKFGILKEKYSKYQGVDIIDMYIGDCYAMIENYSKAIEFYKKAHDSFPEEKKLITSIGNAYFNLEEHDEAMLWFEKLPIEKNNNIISLYNIGVIFYNRGKYGDAAKFFKKATEINNEFAEAFYQLGMSYIALDRISDAIRALKVFIKLAPDSPYRETANTIVNALSKSSGELH